MSQILRFKTTISFIKSISGILQYIVLQRYHVKITALPKINFSKARFQVGNFIKMVVTHKFFARIYHTMDT